jgi:MscS family membrane protein
MPGYWQNEFAGISVREVLLGFYRFLFILLTAWLVSRIVDFIIIVLRQRALKTEDPADDQIVDFLKDVSKALVWIITFFCVLAIVFHVNITSVVAGAGIAGIAIAFAAQETLQNIFGSISIFTEKPFIVGDLVEVNGITGTIEKVGFRSTRVRTADKSYLTIPNKNIVNNTISNLKLRTSRRLQFIMNLTYDTPEDRLQKVLADIKSWGDTHPRNNDRNVVTVYNLGASAIEVWVELYFEYVGWEEWMQLRSESILRIMQIVKNNQVKFAYPTQTIHLQRPQSADIRVDGNLNELLQNKNEPETYKKREYEGDG